jgi:hypothetical protein
VFLFLSGAIMIGCFVAAAFFLRFWRRTSDAFFLMFGVAWLLLGLERLGLAALNQPEEPRVGLYFIRLIAFALIIVAIVYKNRKSAT